VRGVGVGVLANMNLSLSICLAFPSRSMVFSSQRLEKTMDTAFSRSAANG